MCHLKSVARKNRTIYVPCDLKKYLKIINNASAYRTFLEKTINKFPELFPPEICGGFEIKESRYSKKLKVFQRRILVNKISYTIKPSGFMPYMTGLTDDVEKGLFLRKYNVPYEALSYVFDHDAMYWYRLETHLGHYSLVGTTIKEVSRLPQHVIADEKHTWINKNKAYIATTCAEGCFMGVSVVKEADEKSLTEAYGIFKKETQQLKPDYAPKTVNVDGWKATQNAWLNLFDHISLICCFFHVFLGLKKTVTREFRGIFRTVADKLWNCYQAHNKASFSQRIRYLLKWATKNSIPKMMLEKIKKLHQNKNSFKVAYDHPSAYRTSNLLDRLMSRMDHHLFDTQYFHGSLYQAELQIRAWALIHNFAPSTFVTIRKHEGWQSPAEHLNRFHYCENWLHNLLVSAHRAERKASPPNPL